MSLVETLKEQQQQSKQKSEQEMTVFENSGTPIQTEGRNAMLQMMLEKTMKRIELTTANYEDVTAKALESVSESMDGMTEIVENYLRSNEQLSATMESVKTSIATELRTEIGQCFNKNIAAMQNAAQNSISTMQTTAQENIKEIQTVADNAVNAMSAAIQQAKQRERNFFTWTGVKNAVFYVMAAAIVIETILLIIKFFVK